MNDFSCMDNQQVQSRTFDLLRLPLMQLIIFIHCVSRFGPVTAIPSSFAGWESVYDICFIFFTDILARVSLPIFFLMSGYLFFANFCNWSWSRYGEKLKRRVHTLLIPYLMWNSWTILMRIFHCIRKGGWTIESVRQFAQWYNAKGGLLHLFWDCQTVGGPRVDALGFEFYSRTPCCVPMWFLQDLMVMAILAPLIYWLLKKVPSLTIILLFLGLHYSVGIHMAGFSTTYMFYYCFGAFFAIAGRNLIQDFARFRISSLVCAVVCAAMSFVVWKQNSQWTQWINTMQVIICVVATVNIASWLAKRGKKAPQLFSKGSFFVYAAHTSLVFFRWSPLTLSILLLNAVLPNESTILHLLQFLLVPLLTTTICLVLLLILKKFLPRFAMLLTGARQ